MRGVCCVYCDVCALGRCAGKGLLSNSSSKELQGRASPSPSFSLPSLQDTLFSDEGEMSALPCVRDGEKIESDVG